MKETRRYNIEKRIFQKSDIINIGKVFLREYKFSKDNENNSSISFRLDCIDNTSYESEDIGLFDEENIIDIKRTKTIEISYYDYKLNRFINISLVHGKYSTSTLIVKGDDQNWVNGVFTKIKELIDSTKPQDNWIIRHKTFILHLNALGIGIIIYAILNILIYQHIEPIKNPSDTVLNFRSIYASSPILLYVLGLFSKWLLGIPWAFYLREWLLSLWPEIEFDFGPEHLKIEKIRRLRISVFVITAVIPIILSVGYDLFKSFLLK